MAENSAQRQGRHTIEWINTFRQRALIREQFGIQTINAFSSKSLNTATTRNFTGNRPYTKQAKTYKSASVQTNNPFEPLASRTQQKRKRCSDQNSFITMQNERRKGLPKRCNIRDDKLVIDESGNEFKKVRRLLFQYINNERDLSVQNVSSSALKLHRQASNYLQQQLTAEEANHPTAIRLFAELMDPNIMNIDGDLPINVPTTLREKETKNWIKIPWRRQEVDALAIHELIKRERIVALLPPLAQDRMLSTYVSYKLNKPVGVILANYTQVAAEVDKHLDTVPALLEANKCPCRQWATDGCLYDNGHVISTDPSCLKSSLLRSLWMKGRKYRFNEHPDGLLAACMEGIDKYIDQSARKFRISTDEFTAWRTEVSARIYERIQQHVATTHNSENPNNT